MKNTRLLWALWGCALLALGACSVGPAYKRPNIPLPAQWRDMPDQEGSAVWPNSDWWHGFGSDTLDDLISQAQRNNDDLAGAIARIREADAQVRIAGAPLLPSLDFDAGATRQHARLNSLSNPATSNTFSSEFFASYELDFWGKNRASLAAARATALASRYDKETVALTVISSVATTYFQALEFRDRLQVARSNLANGEQILHGFQMELDAGTATGLDVAQQETTVALLRAAIPPLEQQFRQTVHALAVLVGKTPENIDVDTGTLLSLATPPIIEGLPSRLLSRRPDIAESEQQLISANANITVARAALFPSIQLTASGGYVSAALASLISPAGRVWALSAGLTQPIFHGGALRGQVQFSNARYAELLSAYHKTVISAFSNVEDALVAAQQTTEQQQRQQEAVERARRAFQFAQTQMSAGTVNILTVLNTENALFSAQDQLVQIQYLHLQSLVNLFTALGGGWQQG
ncbi:MAG: outer membrane protein multidrug efflux system [Gammaproteobacteria bacterium]|jgi:multidrug efflux system outer membrane protein|nr:transporter [Gammaproteobacteria bacterium]MEA3141841.1 outer membrane protein multidrug efflux system [Gammaproteobacteria bacterium]